MFRAAHLLSSGALNCICSLWFICPCGEEPLSRLSGKWIHFPLSLGNSRSPYGHKTRGCKYSLELLMMSGVLLETCWVFNKLWNNKFYYKAAFCWYFYWVIYDARIHEYQICKRQTDCESCACLLLQWRQEEIISQKRKETLRKNYDTMDGSLNAIVLYVVNLQFLWNISITNDSDWKMFVRCLTEQRSSHMLTATPSCSTIW
jgi:hypothetical protein